MIDIRIPAWIPYLQTIERTGNDRIHAVYKGGEEELIPSKTLSVLIYGECDNLPLDVIEEFGKYNVPLIIHRRNSQKPVWIWSGFRGDKNDVITAQINIREDARKRLYISRKLVKAKIATMESVSSLRHFMKLNARSLEQIRNYEAIMTKRYWQLYFNEIGLPTLSRRDNHPVIQALDAGSKFMSGIVMRWIAYHHLSPYHGFLHEPTDYPSLVYDMVEPYRYIIEIAVLRATRDVGWSNNTRLLAVTIDHLKELLHEEIYCIQTRQYVRRQELVHGIVLALRAYALKLGKRFIIPREGLKNGGRPIKTNFTLPGKSAGYSRIYKPASAMTPLTLTNENNEN